MLTSTEPRRVQQETRRNRNTAARARRAAPVRVLRCLDRGEVVLVALSRRHPEVGYILRPGADGRLVCPCAGYGWRGDCAHVRAAGAGPVRHSKGREDAG